MEIGKEFYSNPDIKKAYQLGFNDGLTCAADNAQEFGYITEDQADELLSELVDIEE
jgi:hypothetical protein